MSNHQKSPIGREDAERIFRGDPAARADHSRLDGLLAAAAGPAGARETAREDVAVAAFAAALQAPPPEPRKTSVLKSRVAKLLTVKVAVACAAVGGVGVALAAGAGVLPGPGHTPATHYSADPPQPARPRPSGSPSRHPGPVASAAELLKLCQRYAAHPDGTRLDDLDRPEFGELVEGAGGKDRDRVDQFCADVLEPDPSDTPSDDPDDDPDDPGSDPDGDPDDPGPDGDLDDPDLDEPDSGGASHGVPDSEDIPAGFH